jgi:fermentation-respiration switch protein FrsA (DUF1100 family)
VTDNHIFDLDASVIRTPVSYKNRYGITIAADLYHSTDIDEAEQHHAIVVGAPVGGVKEQGPGIYAQNMALRGRGTALAPRRGPVRPPRRRRRLPPGATPGAVGDPDLSPVRQPRPAPEAADCRAQNPESGITTEKRKER